MKLMSTKASHLYDPSAQPRHLCQFLQRLSVRVVVLGKLRLHHLHRYRLGLGLGVKPNRPPGHKKVRPEPTCSCSAVKDVRALLAGFGWQSWSDGRAPSRVRPVPFKKHTRHFKPHLNGSDGISGFSLFSCNNFKDGCMDGWMWMGGG